jgi:hypothetical protein
MAAMAAVMFESLFGGVPIENPPSISTERTSATRVILSWPTNAAGMVSRAKLNPPDWTILNAVPYKTGENIRQTNTVTSVPQRYFQLARP